MLTQPLLYSRDPIINLTFPPSRGIILMRKPETFSNWGTSFFAFLSKRPVIFAILLI